MPPRAALRWGLQFFSRRGGRSTLERAGSSICSIAHPRLLPRPQRAALLYELSRKHGERLGAEADAATANVRSFRARHAMKINVAIIAAAAGEMLETIRLDVAAAAEA